MPLETPKDAPAPVPAQSGGDAKQSTAEVEAGVAVEEPVAARDADDVLDALVVHDSVLAVPPPPVRRPAPPASAAREWGAAIVVMILFAVICVAFMSFFRG